MSIWTDFLGAEIRKIRAAGTVTRVVIAGQGRPVVLVHGRGGHLETWRWIWPALARDHYVVAVDLLGHGLTEPTGTVYDVTELEEHFGAVLSTLKLDSYDLVGQSLGGWVAALHALRHRHSVGSIVLIEPAGLLSEEQRLADPAVASAYERGGRAFDTPTDEAVRQRLTGLVTHPAVIDDELVDVRRQLYAPEPARVVHRQVRAADNRPWLLTSERLAELPQRVLFIRGAVGHTPPVVVERAVSSMRSARLVTVPGAKQWPQYEEPALVADLIREHIKEEAHVVLD